MFTSFVLSRLREVLSSSSTSAKGITYPFLGDGWTVSRCDFGDGGTDVGVIEIIVSNNRSILKMRAGFNRLDFLATPDEEIVALLSTMIQELVATSHGTSDHWIDIDSY